MEYCRDKRGHAVVKMRQSNVRERFFFLCEREFSYCEVKVFFVECFVLEDEPQHIYMCSLDLLRGIIFVQCIVNMCEALFTTEG